MLKTFGIAAATLLFVSTAATSFAAPGAGFSAPGAGFSAPGARAAGFGRHGGMTGGPGHLPGFGHPGHGFIHGDHDFHHDHDFFHGDHNRRLPVWWGGWGWPTGWWPDYYDRSGYAYPVETEASYPPPEAKPPSPPPCPEMLHWDTKLGHATREKLCD